MKSSVLVLHFFVWMAETASDRHSLNQTKESIRMTKNILNLASPWLRKEWNMVHHVCHYLLRQAAHGESGSALLHLLIINSSLSRTISIQKCTTLTWPGIKKKKEATSTLFWFSPLNKLETDLALVPVEWYLWLAALISVEKVSVLTDRLNCQGTLTYISWFWMDSCFSTKLLISGSTLLWAEKGREANYGRKQSKSCIRLCFFVIFFYN